MKPTKSDIFNLVCKELNAKSEKTPQFNSDLEAFEAIAKKTQEVKKEVETLEELLTAYHQRAQEHSGSVVMHRELSNIYNTAARLSLEAIGTAAMARKGMTKHLAEIRE